jgi:DNA-binding CsgD family transcriptional regulator/tetratricopeptide (TPR) repeat protein
MIVVRGEAGAGKTRLVSEFAMHARASGATVLRGRATELGGGAYRALGEALLGAARLRVSVDTPELQPFRSALGQLVPEWRAETFIASGESPVVIGEAVLRLLSTLSRGAPSVLVLEDVQWADPDTQRIIEYLADNADGTRTLCVVTMRSSAAGLAGDVIAGLLSRRSATALDVARLPEAAMAAIVRDILGDAPDEVVEALIRRADGLPFLLEELLDAATAAGELAHGARGWEWRGEPSALPAGISDTVRSKLRELPHDDARIVTLAAAYGMAPDAAALALALHVAQRRIVDAFEAASHLELMVAEGGFRFRHALTREAVLAAQVASERAELARVLAPVVEPSDPALAASLWQDAGDHAAAARALALAARNALTMGALSTAVTSADSAARLRDVPLGVACDLDDVLSEALALGGHWERVFEVGNRLLATLVELDAPVDARITVNLRLARAALAAGMSGLAASHVTTARALSRSGVDELTSARIDALDAGAAMEAGRLDDAQRRAQAALHAAEHGGFADVTCEALEVLGRVERLRDALASEETFRRGAELAALNGLVLWEIRGLHELGIAEMFRGELATLERARARAHSAGLLSVSVDIDHQIAGLHVFRLEPEALMVAAERALSGARRLRLDAAAAMAHIHLATAHGMRGRRDEAEEHIAAAQELAPQLQDVAIYGWAQGRGLGSLLQEERVRALREIEKAIELAMANPAAPPGAHLALWPLLRALDHGDADAVEAIRPRIGSSLLTRGFVDYADAVLAGGRGDAAAARAAMTRGDSQMEQWSGFRDLGRRLVAEAALRDGWGDPVPRLRELAARFTERGFEHVAAACRALLRDAGAPVPRPRLTGPAVPAHLAALGVTGRELEVMALVREGLTNAEIAARLVLSVRTVEKHVDNLRAKTGAPNRRELARIPT